MDGFSPAGAPGELLNRGRSAGSYSSPISKTKMQMQNKIQAPALRKAAAAAQEDPPLRPKQFSREEEERAPVLPLCTSAPLPF